MPLSISLDLRKITSRIPRPKALSKAVGAVDDAAEKVDRGINAAVSPIASSRVRGCTLTCDAELTGLADVPAVRNEQGAGYEVALLRLRVARPGGQAECCVRQSVPEGLKRVLVPGARLQVLAHESKPQIAIVKWDESFRPLGTGPRSVADILQYEWPDPEDWPAAGAIEVRDNWRHRRKVDQRRQAWSSAGARLVGATSRGGRTDDRADWTFEYPELRQPDPL